MTRTSGPESPLRELEPRAVWRHFDAIRRIPRPSKHEEQIAEHVLSWARGRGFETLRDRAGNLVVRVPASPGLEAAPGVVLQAHLDMVCEKNSEVEHDFLRDPIAVEVEGDWVHAVGTTLGADNGLGVAAALALADDAELDRGALELLFTLDEETGLNGARALDGEIVRGRTLVNLDSEDEGTIYIGCAGAAGVSAELPLEREAENAEGEVWQLEISGLRGGHSGVDIHERRGNALRLLGRALEEIRRGAAPWALLDVGGGDKANAIPREASARLVAGTTALPTIEEALERARSAARAEFGELEPDLRLELGAAEAKTPGPAITAPCRDRLIDLLNALPHGVLAMSPEVPGLVETSVNLGVLTAGETLAAITCSCRSSLDAGLEGALTTLAAAARLAGARPVVRRGYPGWRPDPDAPLVRLAAAAYERTAGRPPAIEAVHAGLECGVLIDRLPGLQAVSIGPEIRGAHSPDERAQISSVESFYRHLRALVADLARSSAEPRPDKNATMTESRDANANF